MCERNPLILDNILPSIRPRIYALEDPCALEDGPRALEDLGIDKDDLEYPRPRGPQNFRARALRALGPFGTSGPYLPILRIFEEGASMTLAPPGPGPQGPGLEGRTVIR